MSLEDKNEKGSLKKLLHDVEETPSKGLFDKIMIDYNNQKEKRRRFFFIWFLFAFIGVGSYFLMSRLNKTTIPLSKQTAIENKSDATETIVLNENSITEKEKNSEAENKINETQSSELVRL